MSETNIFQTLIPYFSNIRYFIILNLVGVCILMLESVDSNSFHPYQSQFINFKYFCYLKLYF